jgi:hypothetical protein
MAENLVFFDRPKEPRDRIQLPPAASLVRNTGFDTVAVAQKMAGGTMSSNPASSSSQSISAGNPEAVREKRRTLAAFLRVAGDVRRDVQATNRDSSTLSL